MHPKGCNLTQPGDYKLAYPVSFASQQLVDAEINYTTTKHEGLGMVFANKKYLLANPFIFFVDHQAVLYVPRRQTLQVESPDGYLCVWHSISAS